MGALDNRRNEEAVDALLDTLIPGDGGRWPSGGRLRLGGRFIDEASREPGPESLERLLQVLPADFAARDRPEREAVLNRQPTVLVQALAAAAYRVYYTNPIVAERLLTFSRPV